MINIVLETCRYDLYAEGGIWRSCIQLRINGHARIPHIQLYTFKTVYIQRKIVMKEWGHPSGKKEGITIRGIDGATEFKNQTIIQGDPIQGRGLNTILSRHHILGQSIEKVIM